MIWILPMAGRGTRTAGLGEFKPFIKVENKYIIEWLITGIRKNISDNDTLILITTKYFDDKYDFKRKMHHILRSLDINLNNVHFVLLEKILDGPAKTVFEAREYLNNNEPVTICNTDQFIIFEMPELGSCMNHVGYIPVYLGNNPKSSFVKLNEEMNTIDFLVEKKAISNYASAGIYNFNSGNLLLNAFRLMFKNNDTTNNEYYIGPSINYLIQKGHIFKPLFVNVKYDLGNINSINKFVDFLSLINS